MGEMNSESQKEKIRNFEKGFIAAHLINIGGKLKIFEALYETKEGITIKDLASKLGLHEPYLKIWCQTAHCLEILDYDGSDRVVLQPFLDGILGDREHIDNYLHNFSLAVDIIGERLKSAPGYYLTGGILDTCSPERSKAIADATKRVFLGLVFIVFPQHKNLKQMLEQGARFLDIGCGQGNLIIQLSQTFKSSTFVGVDPVPYGIDEAKKVIAQQALGKQVSVHNIKGEDLDYNDEFDMVSMVLVLHELLPDIRVRVVQKAYQALKKGGHLLLVDFRYPSKLEDFKDPAYEFGVLDQFFEACLGVVHLSKEEQSALFTEAGFRNIERMGVAPGVEFVLATK